MIQQTNKTLVMQSFQHKPVQQSHLNLKSRSNNITQIESTAKRIAPFQSQKKLAKLLDNYLDKQAQQQIMINELVSIRKPDPMVHKVDLRRKFYVDKQFSLVAPAFKEKKNGSQLNLKEKTLRPQKNNKILIESVIYSRANAKFDSK